MQNGKLPLIHHPSYDIPLPEKHRFPGTKYSLLLKDLEISGVIESYLKYVPKATAAEHLSIAHDTSYIRAIETGNLSKEQQVRLGLPWSEILRKRSFIAPNGTLLAAQLALQTCQINVKLSAKYHKKAFLMGNTESLVDLVWLLQRVGFGLTKDPVKAFE